MNSLCILDEKLLPAVTGGRQKWEKNVETPKVVERSMLALLLRRYVGDLLLPCLSKSSINRHLRSTEREGERKGEEGGREGRKEGRGGTE